MTEEDRRVIGGVDSHDDTHHAAALDDRGGLLATEVFDASRRATASYSPGLAASARSTG